MIDVSLDKDADPTPLLTLQAEAWELHVWGPLADLGRLSQIHNTSWGERTSLRVGTCAGAPVFWALNENGRATILVGPDDETWDVALVVSLTTVEETVALTH